MRHFLRSVGREHRADADATLTYSPILTIPAPLRLGDKSPAVKTMQGWLCLDSGNGSIWQFSPDGKGHSTPDPHPPIITLDCDGDFGPQTERVLREYQRGHGLQDTPECSPDLFAHLCQPMANALSPVSDALTLRQMIVLLAIRHQRERPRELPRPAPEETRNDGPWVQLYCDGREGLSWCVGFALYIVRAAYAPKGVTCPLPQTLICDDVGAYARANHAFTPAPQPGDLFLLRTPVGALRSYEHCGIVTGADAGTIFTIEGNTNSGGSPNGDGVYARQRRVAGLSFVTVTP